MPKNNKTSPPAPFAVNPMARRGHAEGGNYPLKSLIKRHKPLLTAVILGVSVFAASYNALSAYIKTEQVIVASRYLEPYHQISVSDLKVVELPRKGVHPDSIRKPEDLIGSYTICPLFPGQVVLSGHVISSRTRPGISFEIGTEERAMFVPADESRGVGGLLNPGDRVDLIWSPKGVGVYHEDGYQSDAATVMASARVLRVVHDRSGGFQGVVIAAPVDTCEHIARCLETGSIYLALVPWMSAPESAANQPEVWPGQ